MRIVHVRHLERRQQASRGGNNISHLQSALCMCATLNAINKHQEEAYNILHLQTASSTQGLRAANVQLVTRLLFCPTAEAC
jgi:hypothetical protein